MVVHGFLLPFGYRHSLLEPSCARCGIPPSLRSAYQAMLRLDLIGCHVPHETDTTGVGALCTPGTVVRSRPAKFVRPAPAALSAAGPYLPLELPIGGSDNDEASTRVHAIHPSGLPQPVTPGWNKDPWALNLGLRTPQLPTTHAEAGTVPCALDRKLHHRHQSTLLRCIPLFSCDFVSHDLVDPGRAGGSEVQVEAWMFG